MTERALTGHDVDGRRKDTRIRSMGAMQQILRVVTMIYSYRVSRIDNT